MSVSVTKEWMRVLREVGGAGVEENEWRADEALEMGC